MDQWIERASQASHELEQNCPHDFLLRLNVSDYNCFRFANSQGTQNSSITSMSLELLVIEAMATGARIASVSSSSFEPLALLERAQAALPSTPVNEEYKGLCPPGLTYPFCQTYYPSTATLGSPEKARRLEAFRRANEDLWLGGIWETSTRLRLVAASNGLFLPETSTEYTVEVKAALGERSCSILRSGRRADSLSLDEAMAAGLALLRTAPPALAVPDGTYRCCFGPEAVSEICFFTSLLGFGGRGYKQGTNFTAKKLGQKLFENAAIRLSDDGTDSAGLTRAFDNWGFPRQELTLLDGGTLTAIAHDQFTANSAEENTGHGDGSPMAMRMTLAPGDTTAAALLQGDEPCLHIARFHYPTVADPNEPQLKGSTKDGTYLHRDGQLYDIGGLEFAINPIALLADTEALSKERVTVRQGSLAMSQPGANVVPWLLVRNVTVRNGTIIKV